ncbi:Hypothetical protein R9X50_00187900 [Acrodontium crateriforme]|uniref:NACHT domain-containing protein n=1 Tax=Acrodontium crateriforme TaxID=150365 RepID=A0AAQ3M1I0_9PEZI|nr:Hypothetical protein R9X50_00187900 [Acrodontium crateriforme]
MRLLNTHTLKFAEFRDETRPKYVIASHRWEDGEATFQDVRDGHNYDSAGYKKIKAFAEYARESVPTVEWLWIDTCCINKDSAAELSEAINLMFDWYRHADLCIAYLADVEAADDKSQFEKSKWFKRGWTLQELLAPRMVIFVTKSWQVIGNKAASTHSSNETYRGPDLGTDIATITGISEQALRAFETSGGWSAEERMRWMEGRITTREEDMSYALYGIFGVTPGANYGERRDGARRRLLAAISQQETIAAQQADRFRKIADWLSPPEPWINHESARLLHEPETGAWLLECDDYRNWKSGSFRHLWLYGKAGCGKTLLCSTAIEDVKAHCENAINAGYVIFYFSFSDDQKQRYDHLLVSAVVQLGSRQPGFLMLQQAYEKSNRRRPGREELEKILLACIASYDELFVVLDALDECPENDNGRAHMLTWLIKLTQEASQVKILATSRELPDIRASMMLMGAISISVATHSVHADIRKYLATQLSRDHRLLRLQQTTKELIEETICTKADGMFRWAYCQLQELKKLKSTRPRYIKEALYSLPSTLDETYERMLIAIEDQLRADALTLLRWLAYARSPPTLAELVDATVIDVTGEGHVEIEDRPGLDDTLEILSGLVIIVGNERNEDNIDCFKDVSQNILAPETEGFEFSPSHRQIAGDTKIRLAHFSVKEYLESERILKGDAKDFYLEGIKQHGILSQSCLIYLMYYSNCDEKLSTEQDLATFPLLRYAAESWYYHSALHGDLEGTREADLLCTDATLRDWLQVHRPDQIIHLPFRNSSVLGSGLYYASFLGLEQLGSQILGRGADVNAQGGEHNYALQAASAKGHDQVVQMLLDAGADVNAQAGWADNALQAASYRGYERVVQLLIDAGADVNAQGGWYGSALQSASVKGHEQVVQMLLDAGADFNAQGGWHGNALRTASYHGYERVVQLLIDAGADVNAQGWEHNYALQAASANGHDQVVQMLLDAGADVNAQGGWYGNALQAASAKGHEQVVQMLLDAGADVNAQGGRHVTALQAALSEGHEQVVQMLLDAGADFNAQGGWHGNALRTASYHGYERVVQLLIDAGADVNAQGGEHNYALQAASANGHDQVVQMLLDAGADVNAQGGWYGNALQAASAEGHEQVVQMLLDAGADVNAQGGLHFTALHAALSEGHEQVVQMLLDAKRASTLTESSSC